MKSVLSLTIISGLLFSASVSSASCPLKYSAKMNRMAASSNKTNFYNVAAQKQIKVQATGVNQSGAAKK